MRLHSALTLLLFPLVLSTATAQSGTQPVYPTKIYAGENVITISNAKGIDKIRYRNSRGTTVTVPSIERCPRKVDIRVAMSDPTAQDMVELTVYDCDGGFKTHTLTSENWTIRHERTGLVEVGKDTCLLCQIETDDLKLVDSIVVRDSRFTVKMPSGGRPWRAQGRNGEFVYYVCFRPSSAGVVDQKILLYIRRDQPNGGLTHYVIEKPVTALGAPPPPPPPPPPTRADTIRFRIPAPLPPLEDPTTFRNIAMPTAESVGKGEWFLGSYDIVGLLAGYGITDRLTVMGGGVFVPKFITPFALGTIGAKYEVVRSGGFSVAAGAQYSSSSSEQSDISLFAPYGVISYGNRASRISLAGGYSWKHHTPKDAAEFDRNAVILAIGGDITVARGWKIATETYVIESSGLAPVALTARWFGESFAFDFGFGIDLAGDSEITSTGGLTGEIRDLRIAPILSGVWRFR